MGPRARIVRLDDGFMTVRIRPVVRADIDDLVELCREHAQYERAPYDPDGKQGRLTEALFGDAPTVTAWVAETDAGIIGYATATIEFSTWSCRKYAHMDCLFVRDGMRGQGVGARLLEQVLEYARRTGLHQVQWQTPSWNVTAARFYARAGAISAEKLRFTIDLSDRSSQAQISSEHVRPAAHVSLSPDDGLARPSESDAFTKTFPARSYLLLSKDSQ